LDSKLNGVITTWNLAMAYKGSTSILVAFWSLSFKSQPDVFHGVNSPSLNSHWNYMLLHCLDLEQNPWT